MFKHNFKGIGELSIILAKEIREIWPVCYIGGVERPTYQGVPIKVRAEVCRDFANRPYMARISVELVNAGSLTGRQLDNCQRKWSRIIQAEVEKMEQEGLIP